MKSSCFSHLRLLWLIILSIVLLSCGSGSKSMGGGSGGGNAPPTFGHVFLVVEENHGFSGVIGNSSMPYVNGLALHFGLAAQYFANTHPSIGNYFMLTTGQIETNDDAFSGIISDNNIVRELKNGKTWKSYAENLPEPGYTGEDVYPYLLHHNPCSYFSDVLNDSSEAANLVPFSQFASDLANGGLPNFSFIVPNALNDAHDGTVTEADLWLKQNIQPLLASATFQKDGLLIITFDESETSDTAHGGGHIPTVMVSPNARLAFQSQRLYQHQSLLRLILSSLGFSNFPGAAANAPSMEEFF